MTRTISLTVIALLLALCGVSVRAAKPGEVPAGVTANPDFSTHEKKFPWQPSAEQIARLSSQRSAINYDEAKVRPYTLPDVFALSSGAKVTTPAAWEQQRRGELLDLFRRHVYGFAPERPETLAFRVVESDPQAMGGKATLKRVAIRFAASG